MVWPARMTWWFWYSLWPSDAWCLLGPLLPFILTEPWYLHPGENGVLVKPLLVQFCPCFRDIRNEAVACITAVSFSASGAMHRTAARSLLAAHTALAFPGVKSLLNCFQMSQQERALFLILHHLCQPNLWAICQKHVCGCKCIAFTWTCLLHVCSCPVEEHHQPVLETHVAKEGIKERGELRRGWRKVLLLKQKPHLLLLYLPTKRQGGPLDCVSTHPPVGGNKVEQGLGKSSCLETDPWHLLCLEEETRKVWVLFSGPQTELQIFSPQICLKLSFMRLKWCASSPSSPRGFNFLAYSEFCKLERCWNQLPWALVQKHLMVCGILQISSQAPSPVGGTFPSLILSVARALCLAYSHSL